MGPRASHTCYHTICSRNWNRWREWCWTHHQQHTALSRFMRYSLRACFCECYLCHTLICFYECKKQNRKFGVIAALKHGWGPEYIVVECVGHIVSFFSRLSEMHFLTNDITLNGLCPNAVVIKYSDAICVVYMYCRCILKGPWRQNKSFNSLQRMLCFNDRYTFFFCKLWQKSWY